MLQNMAEFNGILIYIVSEVIRSHNALRYSEYRWRGKGRMNRQVTRLKQLMTRSKLLQSMTEGGVIKLEEQMEASGQIVFEYASRG